MLNRQSQNQSRSNNIDLHIRSAQNRPNYSNILEFRSIESSWNWDQNRPTHLNRQNQNPFNHLEFGHSDRAQNGMQSECNYRSKYGETLLNRLRCNYTAN